jgi:hypothetical protein
LGCIAKGGTAPFVSTIGMVGVVAPLPKGENKGVIAFRRNRLYTAFIYHAKLHVMDIFLLNHGLAIR